MDIPPSDPQAIVAQFRPLDELIPAGWHHDKVMLPDGLNMAYWRTGGDKPPLLLIHGVQVSGINWLRVALALADDYDVIMPDMRGHGDTQGLGDRLQADTLVNDVAAFLDALEIEKPIVMGHSMGADIAGRLAAMWPVEKLVLVDPALVNFFAQMPSMHDGLPPYMAPIVQAIQSLKGQSHEQQMVTGLALLPPGASPWGELDYVSYMAGQAKFDLNFYRHMASLGYLFEDEATISRIDCPILLITAGSPFMQAAGEPPGLAAFKNNWQQGDHQVIEGAGHAIFYDQFERFVAVVRAFITIQESD